MSSNIDSASCPQKRCGRWPQRRICQVWNLDSNCFPQKLTLSIGQGDIQHPCPRNPGSLQLPGRTSLKRKTWPNQLQQGGRSFTVYQQVAWFFFGGIMGFFKTNPYQYYPVDPNRNEQLGFIMNRGTYEKTVCSLTPMGTSFWWEDKNTIILGTPFLQPPLN